MTEKGTISLCVADYCHGCPNFGARTECFNFYAEGEGLIRNVRITCERRELCENLILYLKK